MMETPKSFLLEEVLDLRDVANIELTRLLFALTTGASSTAADTCLPMRPKYSTASLRLAAVVGGHTVGGLTLIHT